MKNSDGAAAPRTLSASEVAERLGVKVTTVYAYVSRGLLTRKPRGAGRESGFAESEVDALLNGRARQTRQPVTFAIDSAITQIADGQLFFRGRDACELASAWTFERVAQWLWTGSDRESARWETPRHDAQISLAPGASAADYMRAALSHLGPQDPFRYDLSPESVMRSAYALLPSLVAVVPLQVDATEREPHTDGTSDFESNDAELALAQALWPRLSAQPSGVAGIALLDMAMSLLADHELATSTFAVRVAGSVRADIYSSLSAGFGAVAGILHGAAGARAHQLLNDIGDADQAVRGLTAYLRDNTALPGFGHPLYPLGDPRARCLLDRLAASDAPAHRVATVFHLIELTEQRGLPAPSIDFALAGVCFAYDMVPGAPEAVFALARTAGWIAHLLEEFEATPLRFRARAHYVGDAIET